MAQAGIIKTITGIVNARTSDGQVRQLMAGDTVYENEIIETTAGSKVTIELNDGKTLAMAENDQIALDETVLAAVDAQDAVVTEVDALQAALEAGEEIPEEEPAAGAEDEGHDYDLAYYAGDQDGGEVGSRLTPTQYSVNEETFEDIDGEEEDTIVITPDPALSAIGVVVDETDIDTANTAAGTITVDYGTAEGGPLALSAAGATWDAASNILIYQQDGTDIWQIVLDQDTGGFTFEQLAAFDHGPDGNDHNALEQFGVTVTATNSFGNSATTTFTAGIYDDGPSITPTIVEREGDDYDDDDYDIPTSATTADPSEHLSVEGDETDGFVGKYVSAEELGIDFGTDGPGSVALSMDSNDPNWEWDGTNNVLYYYQGEEGSREVAWQMGLQAEQGASVDVWNLTHDGGPLTINMLSERLGAIIDGDGETSDLDIHIRLFDENGLEVANNDDFSIDATTGGADGSVHGFDSYLNFIDGELPAGNYTLYVSSYDFDNADPTTGINYDWYSDGDYQITFTGGVIVNTFDGNIITEGEGEIIGQGTITEKSGYGYQFEQINAINHTDTSDHNETATWNINLTVTDSDTDTAGAVITVAIDDDGPHITGNEILSAELGIAASSPATIPGDVIGMVTGDADGEFGTDGAGGFYLWDNNAETDHIMVEDASNNPIYEIFMDSQTGEWIAYQYQPIATDTLDFDFRIYDGDGDWTESELEVPVSQFIVGSNPGGPSIPIYEGEGQSGWSDNSDFPFRDDVENPWEDDDHEVSSTGVDQGAIIGQAGADILVGDPGGSTQILNNNYIIAMDISDSMDETDGDSITRLFDLKTATKDMIDDLYTKVTNSTDGIVKINIMPFATNLENGAWVLLSKIGNSVVSISSEDDGNPATSGIDEINTFIDNLSVPSILYFAQTSYTDALNGANGLVDNAFDENHVIFISDGEPSADEPHTTALQTLQNNGDVDSIRAVGISMDNSAEALLNNIDSTGDAANVANSSELSGVIGNIIAGIDLIDAGSDEIYGDDGNDLIFGDVLNTDNVSDDPDLQDYDRTNIVDLPDGSGWEVFATLETDNPDWTRADTIRYIQEHHEDLAIETVIDDQGREGGHDYIEGGDGNDIIYGQEGNDTIDAGAGDDVIDGGTGWNQIDGGTGYDTLMVDQADEGTGGVLDFSNVDNIELINLNDPGVVQNVEISLNDVFDMTDDNHVLQITGEGTDTVFLTGVGTAAGDWEQDGTDPNSFTQIVAGDSPGSASGPTVTIDPLSDGIDIQVDVDNSTGDFAV